MRVLQLIDSLEAGGAERVAVNIANALAIRVDASFICATRKEGVLSESIDDEVNYLFLNKKSTLDYRAIIKLKNYVLSQKIDIIHAHSSSFFIASLIKFMLPSKVKVVWHLHYGNIKTLPSFRLFVLKFLSKWFNYTFTVNKELKEWASTFLKQHKVAYLPNFPVNIYSEKRTKLKGEVGKKIVCLANLRHPKDHYTLVKAFKLVVNDYKDWSLHLVGKDLSDSYSENLKALVEKLDLNKNVFFYGECQDVDHILNQATIGVLSSESEGLPLSLLEYGLAGLPVVVTNVGECGEVVGLQNERGLLVPPKNEEGLASAINKFILKPKLRKEKAFVFNQAIDEVYSLEAVMKIMLSKYHSII